MRILTAAACTLALTLSFVQRVEATVIHQTATYGGHTYLEIGGEAGAGISWIDAEAYALTVGGHLATVNDAAENNFIADTFNPAQDIYLWIGMNDLAQNDVFVWSSGEAVTYTNFGAGEPNGDGGGVHFWSGSIGPFSRYVWNDLNAGTTASHHALHGIVEINAVPEPGTLLLVAGFLGAFLSRRSPRRSRVG